MDRQKSVSSNMRKVMVTGANGQLGSRLSEHPVDAQMHLVPLGRKELDIADTESIKRAIEVHRPDVIINAAAYTAVDRAESEPELARQINATGPGLLARACAEHGIDFIHVSTDYVFDGEARRPYRPGDQPNPQGIYAATKYDGEQQVEEAFKSLDNPRWWIVRVAWLYDVRGSNFMQTMLRHGRAGKALRIVQDQQGSPTAARPLAAALLTLAKHPSRVPSGIWHCGTEGPTTWFEFAQAIFKEYGLEVDATPCSTAEYPTPAKRPSYSYLDGAAFAHALKLPYMPWELELKNEIRALENAIGDEK